MREGISALIGQLHARGLGLGLVSNQSEQFITELDRAGIGKYFVHHESQHRRFQKPDRIDNDVVPAKLLGLRTVLFRTGRHRKQQPRAADEAPDAEVSTVDALAAASGEIADG